ncbi:MAG TPA: TetR family transcriptional regulator [Kineobactrum sp.]
MRAQPKGAVVPTRRRTQAERTALSDTRMFDAAIKLISEHGTERTTLKEIGELAGYSRGLAHSRFGSKEGFLGQLFTRFDGRWKAHINSHVGEKSGVEAVLAALRAVREFLIAEPSYMRAMYILWYESLGHDSKIRNKLADHHRIYREDAARWVQRGIEQGEIDPVINAEQFSVQFNGFIFGIIYQWLVNAEALDLPAIFDDYESTIRRLLSKKD